MARVLGAVLAEQRANGLGGLLARRLRVRRPQQPAPRRHRVLAHQFEPDHVIARDEIYQVPEKRLALKLEQSLIKPSARRKTPPHLAF